MVLYPALTSCSIRCHSLVLRIFWNVDFFQSSKCPGRRIHVEVNFPRTLVDLAPQCPDVLGMAVHPDQLTDVGPSLEVVSSAVPLV